jgi:uncharacterized double-CXXCG motif protein
VSDWFLLSPDEDYAVTVDACHLWSLPGVQCPTCKQTWATTGPAFPRVDLTGWPAEREYRKPRAVPLEEYQRLRGQLQARVNLPWPLSPGTALGPLKGRIRAKHTAAFVWQNSWTLLATTAAVQALDRRGCPLPAVTGTRLSGPVASDLLEIECIPTGTLHVQPGVATCSACGRQGVSWPRRVQLVRDTLPAGLPVFRVQNFTTMMVASRAFIEAVATAGLTGIVAKPVETLPDGGAVEQGDEADER